MEITTAEAEYMTGVSRFQLSRYVADGRLRKPRHGHIDAASIAEIDAKRLYWDLTSGATAEREQAAADARASFKRALGRVVRARYGNTRPLDAAERTEIEATTTAYAAELADATARRDAAWYAKNRQ